MFNKIYIINVNNKEAFGFWVFQATSVYYTSHYNYVGFDNLSAPSGTETSKFYIKKKMIKNYR